MIMAMENSYLSAKNPAQVLSSKRIRVAESWIEIIKKVELKTLD